MRFALQLLLLLPAAAPLEVQLELHQKTVVTIAGLARIAVGDPAVADVKVLSDGQVELTGEREGRTALLAWKAGGERVAVMVTVGHPPAAQVPAIPAEGSQTPEQAAPVDTGHCGAATGPAKEALDAARRQTKAKDFAAAKASYRKAVAIDPQLGEAHKGLASVLARLQEVDPAAAEYRAFLSACPQHPDAPKVRAILQQFEQHH
jgi:Flp pilus assembly secretin CpaC